MSALPLPQPARRVSESSNAKAAAAACFAWAPCVPPKKSLLICHLCRIHALLSELIREFRPRAVAIESVFTALNVKVALRLAEVRGVVLLAAAQAGIAAFSYSPREVKATVAGYGHAGKEQVQQMVRALLSMTETPEPADASDALAIALCHIQVAEAKERLGASLISARAAGTARRRNSKSISRIISVR